MPFKDGLGAKAFCECGKEVKRYGLWGIDTAVEDDEAAYPVFELDFLYLVTRDNGRPLHVYGDIQVFFAGFCLTAIDPPSMEDDCMGKAVSKTERDLKGNACFDVDYFEPPLAEKVRADIVELVGQCLEFRDTYIGG